MRLSGGEESEPQRRAFSTSVLSRGLGVHFIETPLVESRYEARHGSYEPYRSEAMRAEPIKMC